MKIVIRSNIKWLVSKAGFQQKEVAEEMGISAQHFNSWAKGKNFPKSDALIHLLVILKRKLPDLTLDDLYDYEVVQEDEIKERY